MKYEVLKFWGKSERKMIANWYDALPSNAKFSVDFQARVRRMVERAYIAERDRATVEFVSYDPYPTADDMRKAFHSDKHLLISTLYNNSAIMPSITNLQFRFAHDIHHCLTQDCNFAFQGEICACSKFLRYAKGDSELQAWLFTEIIGQAAYRGEYGKFADEQKFALAPLAWVNTVIGQYQVYD